ncbi:glycosyl transferase family 1 [Aureimonas sp. SA4125]|uniref:glycosyltransferase n=1 Tax=Aureimonas sp. SA4125 TaxID=2826993 RepID=UPI001CC625C9|nr:glycosyltransferase [Aureimonas sp. SA4125]BDA83385.1 glycosyl transferase family 1 [Aureimonas sp. SA4125]
MLHILYLVHDLDDPAVRRRVMMLVFGGAEVTLAGFRRSNLPVREIAGIQPIDLGSTADGKFVQRLMAISAAGLQLGRRLASVRAPDIIIARNLEMLALANRARSLFGGSAPIVYECLDIHRLLLRDDAVGRSMRSVERRLLRNASLLITSSPAFLREYFAQRQEANLPTFLLENKVLSLGEGDAPAGSTAADFDAPMRIGWFGALRCRKSLALLSDFTRQMRGRCEVTLRGRPARSEFADFEAQVAAEPYLAFQGPYRNPEDLAAIYAAVHFVWAIDFFEAGLNSDWLLPNRLYEGCGHGVVPIAMAGTETARFLAEHEMGLILDEATPEALVRLMSSIDAARYHAERERVAAWPPQRWIADKADCQSLVARLRELVAAEGRPVWESAA